MHDFPDPKQGKVIPYGIYDVTSHIGWVNVGINHDTAELAVESIRNMKSAKKLVMKTYQK